MRVSPSLQGLQQTQDEPRARLQRREQDMLVLGMGAIAHGAEAVEGRNADRRGEIAVAAAAGRLFGEVEPDFMGEIFGVLEKTADAVCASIGGAIDAAFDLDRYVLALRL